MATTTTLKNIYLFHGADNYSANAKIKHWRIEFEKKYGDLNSQIFEGEDFTANNFKEAICTLPFLSDKKLIIIRDFLRDSREEDQKTVAEQLDQIPEFCIIVFIEKDKPDARKTLYKKIIKTGQNIEFTELEKFKLIEWIKQELGKKNTEIGPAEIDLLAENVGPNLWQMSQEVEKISLYANNQKVDEQAIEMLISPNLTSSIFKLTDFIAQKNRQKSLKTLNTLLNKNEDLMQIFFMIVRHFRIMIQIQSCLEKKMARPQIIQKLKEHPFVINNISNQAKNFNSTKLNQIYKKLLEIDIATKSGKIKTTTLDNTELRLAVEKLILELCS